MCGKVHNLQVESFNDALFNDIKKIDVFLIYIVFSLHNGNYAKLSIY